MSIKLAKGEVPVKKYDYATTHEGFFNKRKTSNSLIVTNKRIIKSDACTKTGYENISLSEIAVEDVSGIRTRMSSSFKFFYLFWGIVFSLITFFFITMMPKLFRGGSGMFVMLIGLVVFGGLAALFIYKFIKSRKNVLVCDFIVGNRLNNAMSMGAVSFRSIFNAANRTNGKSSFVKIVVDASVARDFVNEIGAVLIDIKNGNIETEAE
jgi:hypothetical protein